MTFALAAVLLLGAAAIQNLDGGGVPQLFEGKTRSGGIGALPDARATPHLPPHTGKALPEAARTSTEGDLELVAQE